MGVAIRNNTAQTAERAWPMNKKYTGKCLCGNVSYIADEQPKLSHNVIVKNAVA